MADLWPWLAVVGLGALHGLSPASGWMFAAACGWQAGGAAPVREITASGPLALAAAAVGVHMAAMLLTTGALASAACRTLALRPHAGRSALAHRAWTAALVVTGVWLLWFR